MIKRRFRSKGFVKIEERKVWVAKATETQEKNLKQFYNLVSDDLGLTSDEVSFMYQRSRHGAFSCWRKLRHNSDR